jgi:hypothetical protein
MPVSENVRPQDHGIAKIRDLAPSRGWHALPTVLHGHCQHRPQASQAPPPALGHRGRRDAALMALAILRLGPALPSADRASQWIDTVQQGDML